MKPAGSGAYFHCDSARMTSRSKMRLVDEMICTSVTAPLAATIMRATTRPVMPSRSACRGNVGCTRLSGAKLVRTGGPAATGGPGGGGVYAFGGGPGGGGVVVTVVI